MPALLGGYVFLNTKRSRIVRILLCLKYELQPELGSGLTSRERLRPTLPGSRVTRRDWRLATLAWSKWRSSKKTKTNIHHHLILYHLQLYHLKYSSNPISSNPTPSNYCHRFKTQYYLTVKHSVYHIIVWCLILYKNPNKFYC